MHRLNLVLVTAALTVATASCARDRQGMQVTAQPGHWGQSGQLRRIMGDLDRQAQTNWPQELGDEYSSMSPEAQQDSFAEACTLAASLADAAQRIPDAVADIPMAEVDRRSFMAQVETLREQARTLEEAAADARMDRMRTALAEISATCDSCHHRFRDFSGPLS